STADPEPDRPRIGGRVRRTGRFYRRGSVVGTRCLRGVSRFHGRDRRADLPRPVVHSASASAGSFARSTQWGTRAAGKPGDGDRHWSGGDRDGHDRAGAQPGHAEQRPGGRISTAGNHHLWVGAVGETIMEASMTVTRRSLMWPIL